MSCNKGFFMSSEATNIDSFSKKEQPLDSFICSKQSNIYFHFPYHKLAVSIARVSSCVLIVQFRKMSRNSFKHSILLKKNYRERKRKSAAVCLIFFAMFTAVCDRNWTRWRHIKLHMHLAYLRNSYYILKKEDPIRYRACRRSSKFPCVRTCLRPGDKRKGKERKTVFSSEPAFAVSSRNNSCSIDPESNY